jgi:hypothetical protein
MPNILIHPNSGIIEFSTGIAGGGFFNPNFTGGGFGARINYDNYGGLNLASYVSNPTGVERFSIDGANGRLFSVTDSLSGSLFSVNDIAGLPIIEAFDDNTVIMGAFNRNDFIITGNSVGIGALPTTGTQKLFVSGNLFVSGSGVFSLRPTVNGTGVVLSGEAATPTNLASTGSTLQTNINNLSGYVNSSSSNIMFITGNQTVSGLKNFTTTPQVSGQPVYFLRNIRSFTGNNFTPDANEARVFEYVLTGVAGATATLNAPINMVNGDSIIIEIQQSPSGSNNMAFNFAYKFPGGVTPSLTLQQSRVDIYTVLRIGSNFYSTYFKDFSN